MKLNTASYDSADINNGLIVQYFKDIAKYPPLKNGEEAFLARKIKKGDITAMEKLVKSNLRFVIKVARGYQSQGMELIDLINVGNMGLIKAAKRFDENKNFKFISYVVWWIRQSILQALADQSRIYKLPINKVAEIYKVFRTTESLKQKYQRYPCLEEIAVTCDMKTRRVDSAALIAQKYLYLDTPTTIDSDTQIGDILEDTSSESPYERMVIHSFQKKLLQALDSLHKREKEIVLLYYGIGQETSYTLEEIGKKFNITRERVRQLKDKAILQLRNHEIKNLSDDYYNN